MFPSLVVFGPQARLSSDDLATLQSHLTFNTRLSKLSDSIRSLSDFWPKLVCFDPELAKVPGESALHCLEEWLTPGYSDAGSILDYTEFPAILSCPLNFLLQIVQYHGILVQYGNEGNAQQAMLQKLRHGGVQGFCLGLLCAITVAVSGSDEELIDTAIRVLRLAICIGAYVDKDAINQTRQRATCISVRGPGVWTPAENRKLVAKVLEDFPDGYVSAFTDEVCMTLTTSPDCLSMLKHRLSDVGFSIQSVPVDGRFHCFVYDSEVHRLVQYFGQAPDLRLPGADQLHLAVRSGIDGTIIKHGELVQHALENTLLRPVEWYKTLQLAVASLPIGHKSVVLAGISPHFPQSLRSPDLDVRHLSLNNPVPFDFDIRVTQESRLKWGRESSHHARIAPSVIASPSHTGTDDDGVLSLDDGCNTTAYTSTRASLSVSDYPPHAIAVVGMAGRFPGANSVDELWELLSSGRSMVDTVPDRVGLHQLNDDVASMNWWGNFLDDHDTFDNKFFAKSAREAIACDPQQRKLLEVVYDALESSGQLGAEARSLSPSNDYGCYIGAVTNNYSSNISCHPPTAYAVTGTTRAFLSGTLSHYFGWTGPAVTIDTACSSSLVAVHMACRAIATGECSRAIAGGTNIITCPYDYRDLRAAGFLSPTGQCKPFDAGADGYCRGEAVGAVILKSLSAALEENDKILGVIVGSAISQNSNGGPIVVPDAQSQTALLKKVIDISSVLPGEVTYVEAHGTGTSVGDPIEVRSLREAFGEPSRISKLLFSSIKGNIGHAEAASGVAGLIKVLLMMRNEQIPPQASYESLNPTIPDLGASGMEIPRKLTPWTPLTERIACVNNYGAAGSNSVVMVKQAPAFNRGSDITSDLNDKDFSFASKLPLILTASTQASLSSFGQRLLDWVRHKQSPGSHASLRISDVLFNLARRANHTLQHVVASSIRDVADLELVLSAVASDDSGKHTTKTPSKLPAVVIVFGGQEDRSIGLSEAVFTTSQIFRHHVDTCHNLSLTLGLIGYSGLYPAIFHHGPIDNIVTLHLSLFSVQYACAKAWIDCGLEVAAIVGHSFGHLTALCVSGVLSLRDSLRFVAGRASLIEKYWGSDPGSMIAIKADHPKVVETLDKLRSRRGGYAEIACFNGPKSHVIVGSKDTLQVVEALVDGNIRVQRLDVTHGFHSKFTEPLLSHLEELANDLEWRKPMIHLETCDEHGSLGAQDADHYRHFIVEHARRPVYFQQAVTRLMKLHPNATWLGAGLGSSCTQLVRACAEHPERNLILSPRLTTASAPDSLVDVTISLWKEGHAVQYWPFHRSQQRQYENLNLPSYQFLKTRHWLPFSPFVTKATNTSNMTTPGEEDYELVRLIKGGRSSSETIFRISPSGSKRFQSLVTGHIVCDSALVPASAYIEISSRAALMLEEDLKADIWTPTVENLVMKAPIAGMRLDQVNPYIIMSMQRLNNNFPSWAFVVKAAPKGVEEGSDSPLAAYECALGSVHLHKRDDPQSPVAQDMRRYSTLTGRNRWEQIMNDPRAEGIRGKHIYRTFSKVVEYADAYRGVNSIMCRGTEAAGTVKILPDIKAPPDQRLTDTHTIDSFMQFGGLLANCFNEIVSHPDSLFVCHHIQRVQIGPAFSPDSKDWFVLANMMSLGIEKHLVDVYVFETKSNTLVFMALGMSFTKISRTSLIRAFNESGPVYSSSPGNLHLTQTQETMVDEMEKAGSILRAGTSENTINYADETRNIPTKRAEILQIIASIADVPEHELSGDTCLLGLLDSLGATEAIGDINSSLNVVIDLSTFVLFPDIKAIIDHVDHSLGFDALPEDMGLSAQPHVIRSGSLRQASTLGLTDEPAPNREKAREFGNAMFCKTDNTSSRSKSSLTPTTLYIHEHFERARLTFDALGKTCQSLDYWSEVHPDDVRLVMAYTTEAFRALGCDILAVKPTQCVPEVVGVLPRHQQLICRFHRFLEEEGVIQTRTGGGYWRTTKVIDATPAEEIFRQIVDKQPSNLATRQLLRAIGPHMANCLKGGKDALQILFGDRSNKKWLDELYRDWPMLVTATQLLGDFLCQCFMASLNEARGEPNQGPFRILEVGAGTGGTTRHIVNLLTRHGIQFEYYFTDVSGSFVHKARTSFKDVDGMNFDVLDVELEPPSEYIEAFHAIISTNCIHATSNLPRSLNNLRKMLRDDGVLALIEMTPSATHSLYVMDVIFGLLEGWWLFNDGRSHALADVDHWARAFSDAGFGEVLWSDGATLEAKTVRVICGFRKPRANSKSGSVHTDIPGGASVQEVVYKTVGSQELHADIYCPRYANMNRKMPIALMIHGGSHILFSRKDIRPPQTRILLEMGFLPVSLDHRLCPEIRLVDGPMEDICDAVDWARTTLPYTELHNPDIKPDPENVVVIGWSSGGQLALSTGWTLPERVLRAPEAILAFYCPTDYEDDWWRNPIQPIGAEDWGEEYDVLEGVEDHPITNYGAIGAWEPLSDPRIRTDSRARIVLHMNWKAQTLPVIIEGLPSRARLENSGPDPRFLTKDSDEVDISYWNALPQPPNEEIRRCSPLAQVRQGNYATPTFLVHGTADDLIPWQQSSRTAEAMKTHGVEVRLILVPGAPHICDGSRDPQSAGWQAVLEAYKWLGDRIYPRLHNG